MARTNSVAAGSLPPAGRAPVESVDLEVEEEEAEVDYKLLDCRSQFRKL